MAILTMGTAQPIELTFNLTTSDDSAINVEEELAAEMMALPYTTPTAGPTPPNASQHLDYTHCWSSTNTTQRLPAPRLHPLLVQHHPTPPST
ncbi:unnamed protein product [Gadus morhua 'NCC']